MLLLQEEARQRDMLGGAGESSGVGFGLDSSMSAHKQLERITNAYENLQVERDVLLRRVQGLGKFGASSGAFGSPIRGYDSVFGSPMHVGSSHTQTDNSAGLVEQLTKSQATIVLLKTELDVTRASQQDRDQYTSLAALESELIVAKATATAAVEEMKRLKAKRATHLVDYEALVADNENLKGMLAELEEVVHAGNREKHLRVEHLNHKSQLQSAEYQGLESQLIQVQKDQQERDFFAAETEQSLKMEIKQLQLQLADAVHIASSSENDLEKAELQLASLQQQLEDSLIERVRSHQHCAICMCRSACLSSFV